MTPGKFDFETCKEVLGHEIADVLIQKANKDADDDTYNPPEEPESFWGNGGSYWDNVTQYMKYLVYYEQYKKRKARNFRKQQRA